MRLSAKRSLRNLTTTGVVPQSGALRVRRSVARPDDRHVESGSVTDGEIFEAIRQRVGQGRPTDSDQAWSPPAPASEDDVRRAEAAIGYPLPPLLRRIYLELADGGIGPRGGIEGVAEGWSPLGELTDWAEGPRDDPDEPPAPPRGLFPTSGAAMRSPPIISASVDVARAPRAAPTSGPSVHV
jgi:hypothetical protein